MKVLGSVLAVSCLRCLCSCAEQVSVRSPARSSSWPTDGDSTDVIMYLSDTVTQEGHLE